MAGVLTATQELNFLNSTPATTFPVAELIAAGDSEPALMEICVVWRAASSCVLALGRSSSVSVPAVFTYAANDDPDDQIRSGVGATKLAYLWNKLPGAPTQYFRRGACTTAGGGFIWNFPKGMHFNAAASLSLFVLSTAVASGQNQSWWVVNE